jgi:nucleoid-associated protein YgaU
MGLFSFLKNAGSKLFTNAEEEAAAKAASAAEVNSKRIDMLETIIRGSGIEIDNLELDLVDDIVTIYGQVDSQSDKEKAVLVLGNIEGVGGVDDRLSVVNPAPEAVFYEVQKGDSLSKIAKAHYGDAMKYMEIFEANQPMLKDPNLIYPGQVLRIPTID